MKPSSRAIVPPSQLRFSRQPRPFNIQMLEMRRQHRSWSKRTTETGKTNLYQISDARIRERVPHEPLPHAEETYRDGARALPHGETDKNLVSESKNEVKERDTGDKGIERAGETGAGAEGSGSCGGGGGRARPSRPLGDRDIDISIRTL
ncbi:hypothetical protein RR48_13571 [Papilio machaon]|uniref:Uncharacterized protein n=1 Tax=Papilio machaon TaxID=76193 RepID=A0A194RB54_PAPMA|nr:hypothetical protein RR48_13571 [Papilio machaon]